MTSRSAHPSLLTLAALALGSSVALAQQPPAPADQPAPPAASAPESAAPIERQPPSDDNAQPGAEQGKHHGAANFHHHEGNPLAGKAGSGFNGVPADRFREPHEGGFGPGYRILPEGLWWNNPQIAQKIGLTPDQIKRINDTFQKSRIELIDLKANLEKQDAYLEPILAANPPDTAKALAQIDKIADARASLEKAHARVLLGIRSVLTPEQWTKLSSHRGPGGPEGPGGGGFPGHGPNFVQPEPMQ